MTQTLYFRAPGTPTPPPTRKDYGEPEAFDEARPYGLWARVLRAVATRPIRMCEIHKAAAPSLPVESSRVRKHRTVWAVKRLVELGLVARTDDGFLITAAGVAALDRVREAA